MKNKIDSPAAHTPTPWNLNPKAVLVIESEGVTVASCGNANVIRDQWEANAAFIVRAVNAHEELLSLLKEARNRMIGSAPAIRSLSERTDKAITRAEGR